MKFLCTKHTKIIGSNGIYSFTGGAYETSDAKEIQELKAHPDVKEAKEPKTPKI